MGKIQPDYPRGLDFEQVWAAIQATGEKIDRFAEETSLKMQESAERMKETDRLMQENAERMKETDRMIKENAELIKETGRMIKETDRQLKETDRQVKETDRQVKEYNRRFGDFTNRFGEIVEYMVAPNLREKFKELGIIFQETSNDRYVEDPEHDIAFEVDVMLQNGDKAMLVETKTKPTTEDVREHVKRLEKMRRYANLHGDKRKFLGAVAGVVMTKNVKEHILKQGFFAVEPSGETFNVFSPQGQPHEW